MILKIKKENQKSMENTNETSEAMNAERKREKNDVINLKCYS